MIVQFMGLSEKTIIEDIQLNLEKNRNGYYIEQMQSMCNREYAKEDYIYVQSLIV